MISQQAFHDALQQNIERVNEYESGMDGTGGQCDCIGLIIGAIRLAGGKWKWTHGSNYAMRYRMKTTFEIENKNQLRVDQLVYKAREPGDSKWDLPEKYKNHADQRDYYHVGVVESVNPLRIVHCTSVSGGIKRDTSLGAWKYAGEIDQVGYENGETEEMTMAEYKVIGGNLNMRTGPGVGYSVVKTIPDGATVNVVADEGQEWMKVEHQGRSGYCMGKYLQKAGADTGSEIETAFANLENAMEALRKLIIP